MLPSPIIDPLGGAGCQRSRASIRFQGFNQPQRGHRVTLEWWGGESGAGGFGVFFFFRVKNLGVLPTLKLTGLWPWKWMVGISYYCWWFRNLAISPTWDVFLPYEYWDINPTSTGDRRISEPSTVVSFCGPAYFQGPVLAVSSWDFPDFSRLRASQKGKREVQTTAVVFFNIGDFEVLPNTIRYFCFSYIYIYTYEH